MAAPALPLAMPDEALGALDHAAARAQAAAAERRVFREVFKPRVRMSLLEWAESRRYLSPEANALAADSGGPVRYSTTLTPYHREIMLALSDPRTEYVACKLPSQDGKTEIANNFVGWRIDCEPGPMLVMQPTKEMGEAWSKDRLSPMIRDSPALRGKVREARSRDSDNTITHKKFPGGHVTITGSNSAAGLASRPIRDLVVDEVDRCAKSAGSEGDSIGLATRRTTTFRRGKKLLISSPTIKRESRIDQEYEHGTQEEWHVPCPHCGAYQFLVWGGSELAYGLKWDAGKPDTAHYVCVHHGCVIEEHQKGWMIAQGKWIAQNPEAGPRRRSFWKNALTSNLVPWRKLVAEWLEVKGKPEQRQQFVNTVLCELWDPVDGEEVSADGLLARLGLGYPEDNRHEPGTVPGGVGVLVRTCDTQGYGIETAVWGFGAGEEAWLVDWDLCEGDPALPEVWKELDRVRAKRYTHEGGASMRPRLTFIDSGGHYTKETYAYCRTRQAQQVYAIKGKSDQEGVPLLGKPTRPDSAKTVLYHVGSYTGKLTFLRRLLKITEPGPGFIHLPEWLQPDQVQQFTNFQLISKVLPGGKRVRLWAEKGRVEQPILYVYALAALLKLGHATIKGLGDEAARLMASGAQQAPAVEESGVSEETPPPSGGLRARASGLRQHRR